ncbi:MAG: hypothetical protein WBE60_08805, partial [Nitrosotalea sp.]
INNAGQIVGNYIDSVGHYHGFLLASGNYTPIDYPGENSTAPYGINNAGQIVGYYYNNLENNHGFLLLSGNYTSIDYPGANSTAAFGINNAGQIVGSYYDDSGHYHGFLLSSGETIQTTPEFGPVAPIILGISILSIIILSVRTRFLHRS